MRPPRWHRGRGAALVGLLVLAIPSAATAESWRVVAGFDGVFRSGSWMPVLVTADAADLAVGDVVHVLAPDADGTLVRSPPATARTGADGTVQACVRVRSGRPGGRLEVEHVTGQGTSRIVATVDLPEPVSSTDAVTLVVGELAAAGRAARLAARPGGPRPRVVQLPPPQLRPADGSPLDYDGVDAVVACGGAVADLDDDTLAALDGWVRSGGRLVLAAGASAEGLAARGGVAATWLPGRFDRLVPLRRTGAIETFARAGRVPLRSGADALQVPVFATGTPLDGSVEVAEGSSADLPLAVRSAHGLGTIAWIGLDLDRDPFRSWPGTDTLLVGLSGDRTRAPDRASDDEGGTADLAGQLRTAIEQGTAGGEPAPVTPVPFFLVGLLGLAYVAALYPLDWWLVSRTRPWVSWLSLPLVVGAFTAAAWFVGRGGHPLAAPQTRVVQVLDVDAATRSIEGRSWFCLWSPANTRIDVAAIPGPATDRTAISWTADAGRGFGATDAVTAHPMLSATTYGYGTTLAQLESIGVAAGADLLCEGRWTAATEGVVSSTLDRDAQGALRGAVSHTLPFPLRQCRLLHGGWLYDVGDLPPGAVFDPGTSRGPRSLAGALTRRTAQGDRDVASRWNPSEPDVARILEIAGFHAAAGGLSYTGREPGRLGRLDLSPLLPLERAILVGFAPEAETAWTTGWRFRDADGEETGWRDASAAVTMVRIVIPLARVAAEADR